MSLQYNPAPERLLRYCIFFSHYTLKKIIIFFRNSSMANTKLWNLILNSSNKPVVGIIEMLSTQSKNLFLHGTASKYTVWSHGTLNGIKSSKKIQRRRMRMQKGFSHTQLLQLLVLSLHVNIKIESRVNFEKAFYYFGITFYFTGFVTVLSLSCSLSLHLYVLIFVSPAFSRHRVVVFFFIYFHSFTLLLTIEFPLVLIHPYQQQHLH